MPEQMFYIFGSLFFLVWTTVGILALIRWATEVIESLIERWEEM